MAKLNQVIIDDRRNVLAIYPQGQIVDVAAHESPGRKIRLVVLDEDVVSSATVPIRDDEGLMIAVEPRKLPEDWEESYEPPVPDTVSARNMKLQMLDDELLDDFEAAVEALDEKDKRAAQITVADPVWSRSDPILAKVWKAMKLTKPKADDLHRRAGERKA